MYSSGGDLHLDLPVSASDATQRIWVSSLLIYKEQVQGLLIYKGQVQG